MIEAGAVVQKLQDLGITRIEAEVYLATLQESNGGPVSGYRVAQSVGKDPANLSKTLASLEVLGAVRTIQEKPRLYIPIAPADFTDKLIADMEANRRQVLKQLADLDSDEQQGIPMALNNRKQSLAKAAELMSRCRNEMLIFADVQTLKMMGTDLEVLAASTDVEVRLLCLEKFTMPGVMETTIDKPFGFSEPDSALWLHMIVDRKSWLSAKFSSAGAEKLPCGWWSYDESMALIMGATLDAALKKSSELPPLDVPTPAASPEASSEFQKGFPKTEPKPEPAFKEPEPPVESSETTPQKEPDQEDDSDGLQFIIRHDESE